MVELATDRVRSLSLKDASFQNAQDGTDFRISNLLSNTNVEIRSVRVIRGDP